MRIIAGDRRGKKLLVPVNFAIRPTSDRARESIFNILAHQKWVRVAAALPIGAHVLDICCGTGALAAEALSRGAASAVLYDNSASSLKLATQNIAALRYEDRTKVEFADLANLPVTAKPYDLIFCDPPYDKGLTTIALAQIVDKSCLAPQGLLVMETGANENLVVPDGLELHDQRRYGAAMVWFLSLK